MPLAIQISVSGLAPLAGRLDHLQRALAPARISAVAGQAARRRLRTHLLGLNRSRANSLGGRRTNFYQQAGNSTSIRTEGDTVVVSVASVGLAQRYFGGTITAKNAKYLTIPARPEAYGKRASEFNDLQFVVLPQGGPALIRRSQSTITFRRAKGGTRRAVRTGERGGEVMFWLRRSITQDPDPSVLPTEAEFYSEVEKSLADYIQLQIDRAGGGGTSAQV